MTAHKSTGTFPHQAATPADVGEIGGALPFEVIRGEEVLRWDEPGETRELERRLEGASMRELKALRRVAEAARGVVVHAVDGRPEYAEMPLSYIDELDKALSALRHGVGTQVVLLDEQEPAQQPTGGAEAEAEVGEGE